MTARIYPVRLSTIPRRQRAAVTFALGLSAGAVGWSGLAQAVSEETASQVLLLPEHYELMDNGVVVFKLETGETISLTADQYLIMEDGLLLITDELAQASFYSLPVMGAVRAQLMSDIQPVRSPDGSVVLASDDSPLWSGDGPAPRLFEQVDLQRYEIAQVSDGSSSEVSEAVAVGLLSPGAIALLGVLMTSDQPESETEVEEAPAHPAPPSGEFWTNDDVADSASNSITGTNVNSFVGYTAASKTAVVDPISNFAAAANTGTIDLSAGGNNYVQLGDSLAKSGGKATYTGADQIDVVRLSSDNVKWGATLTMQMGNGGNSLSAGTNVAYSSSTINYNGGDDSDYVEIGRGSVRHNGTLTLDMGDGANTLSAGTNVAYDTAAISYTGGDNQDTIKIGNDSLKRGGSLIANMGEGTNKLTLAFNVAFSAATPVQYAGGDGSDTVTIGDEAFYNSGDGTFTMGNGANSLTLGANAAYSSGGLTYTGGDHEDSIQIGDNSLRWGGSLIANMGDGTNELILGATVAYSAATPVKYEGGDGSDNITVGDKAFYNSGDGTFTMGNGANSLTIGDNFAYNSGDITYVGGLDSDTITVGGNAFYFGAQGNFTMGNGSNSLTVGATASFFGGAIDYDGGSGVDTLSFGDNLATDPTGSVEINLGAGDTADDIVTFSGAVGTGSGSTVTIQNFNFNDDRIHVATAISATVNEIVDDGLGNLTWTDSNGNHKLVFAGIGIGGTGVVATSAELAATII